LRSLDVATYNFSILPFHSPGRPLANGTRSRQRQAVTPRSRS